MYSIAHHCSYLQQQELPCEPLPNNSAKAPVPSQTSARNRARQQRIRCCACVQQPFNERVAMAQQVHSKSTAIKLRLCDLVQCVLVHESLAANFKQTRMGPKARKRNRKRNFEVCTQMKSVCTLAQMYPSEKKYLLYKECHILVCTQYILGCMKSMCPVHTFQVCLNYVPDFILFSWSMSIVTPWYIPVHTSEKKYVPGTYSDKSVYSGTIL